MRPSPDDPRLAKLSAVHRDILDRAWTLREAGRVVARSAVTLGLGCSTPAAAAAVKKLRGLGLYPPEETLHKGELTKLQNREAAATITEIAAEFPDYTAAQVCAESVRRIGRSLPESHATAAAMRAPAWALRHARMKPGPKVRPAIKARVVKSHGPLAEWIDRDRKVMRKLKLQRKDGAAC